MSSSSIDIAGAPQFYCRNIFSLLAILPLHCCTFTKQLHLKVVLAHQTFIDFVRALSDGRIRLKTLLFYGRFGRLSIVASKSRFQSRCVPYYIATMEWHLTRLLKGLVPYNFIIHIFLPPRSHKCMHRSPSGNFAISLTGNGATFH